MIRPVLMGIWMGGASLVALLAAIRMARFQRMLAGTLPASQRIQSLAAELANRMELRRSPDIRVVDSAIAPLVWCLGWRPAVVLPLRLIHGLDEPEIAMVLVHELAHLRPRDHWVRVIELITSVLYWWNPLVWWVRRQLHAVEEHCCDSWVAWFYPDQSQVYAESLLKAAELLPARMPLPALASPFLNAHTLKERIEMVLQNRSQRTVGAAAAWIALMTVVGILAGVRGLAGDELTKPTAPVAGPKPTDEKPVNGASIAKTPQVKAAEEAQAAAAATPVAKELELLQGEFKFERWRSDKWPSESAEFETWRWKVKGREIIWTRPNQEELRLSFTVDAKASPRRIDLTFLNGPEKGNTCQGIYLPARHEIDLCFQDPGAKVNRPSNSGSLPGSQHTSLRLVPAKILPVADEVAALQGVWKFDIYYSDWWPGRISDPPVGWAKWNWTVKGKEIRWSGLKSGDVNLSFSVDPAKFPRQIDMIFLDGPHKGKKLLGMYQFFAEDACYICFADPDSKVARPTEVAYSTNSGKTMVSIERVPLEMAAAKPPTGKEKPAERGTEIDAAIARLRKRGASVREFHPRGDPQYWVQILSNYFDDANLVDVEIIGRDVPLYLHLSQSSVTPAGLERLASTGKINQLELSGEHINNSMLKVLPKLPLQGQLGLYSDTLTDAGIKSLADCRQLSSVSLDGKGLTNACLEHLTGLPKLQRVALGKNFTRGAFDILGRLKALTILDVSELDPDLSDFKKVPNLRTLSLSGEKYDDEAARAIADTFTALEDAYLRHTSITNTGVQHLSRLKNLKILTLDGSHVDDGIADSIRKLKQLTWLSVGDCAVGDDTLAAVSECPDIWYVFFINTKVTDKGIAHLAKLKKPLSLYLAQCKSVTDAGIKSLALLPDSANLHIELTGSGVTENGIRQLKAALPHAQIRWGSEAVPLK